MYAIGSIADLISGSETPNKPQVEIKEVKGTPFKSKKTPQNTPKKDGTPKPGTPDNSLQKTPKQFTPKQKNIPKKLTPKLQNSAKKFTPKQEKSPKNLTPQMQKSPKKFTPGQQKTPKKFTPEDAEKKSPVKRKADAEQNQGGKKIKTDVADLQFPLGVNAKNAVKRMKDTKKERLVDPEKDARTIFVGNIPLNTEKKFMIKYFSKYGKVQSVRFRSAARADLKMPKKTAFITKKFHPKTTTHNCYVMFEDKSSIAKALEANGEIIKDNHIRVDVIGQVTEKPDPKLSIFVGNIPFDAKDEDLWSTFNVCGPIKSVRLVKDGLTGIGKGLGYVNFETTDAVELALQMTDVKIKNRVLRVQKNNANSKSTKKNLNGEKNRMVPRNPEQINKKKNKKPIKFVAEQKQNGEAVEESMVESSETTKTSPETKQNYQGVKFSDKKKQKKTNKTLLKKKKMSKILAPKKTTA